MNRVLMLAMLAAGALLIACFFVLPYAGSGAFSFYFYQLVYGGALVPAPTVIGVLFWFVLIAGVLGLVDGVALLFERYTVWYGWVTVGAAGLAAGALIYQLFTSDQLSGYGIGFWLAVGTLPLLMLLNALAIRALD